MGISIAAHATLTDTCLREDECGGEGRRLLVLIAYIEVKSSVLKMGFQNIFNDVVQFA